METNQQRIAPILESAWTKYAQFDTASSNRTLVFNRLRLWIAIFGVLATLFAILTVLYPAEFPFVGRVVLKVFLVASPITASVLAAFTSKFFSSGDWLITRAGAEESLRDIYLFRTILQNDSSRHTWLEHRIGDIQRSVYRGMNGELVLESYKGILPPPPRFDPKYPNSDPGFNDLTGDEYYNYRLMSELNWHIKKVNQLQKQRVRLQAMILLAGAAGAFLAALGGDLTIWVALTASLTATLIGWQELKNLDVVVRNYSKVILELTIISDHWLNLEVETRTQSEFYSMVQSTEDMLWSRNVEYIKAMQEALKESSLDEEASLINRVIQEQRASDRRSKRAMEDALVGQTTKSLDEASETITETFKEALGALAEEAASDVVQAELAAMKEAMREMAENLSNKLGLSSALDKIKEEFSNVEISADTPMSVLNDLLSRYPKTEDVKG
ncbi:MAG: SLATT domain-containing protein [Anaerolineales bacterium]|jgi:hypothetical protein|nr:SLATT domain-containing protein [Anaerolineales bacterium]